MEETVPKSLVQRAHVDKHVEYPNNNSSKVSSLHNNLISFRGLIQFFRRASLLLSHGSPPGLNLPFHSFHNNFPAVINENRAVVN